MCVSLVVGATGFELGPDAQPNLYEKQAQSYFDQGHRIRSAHDFNKCVRFSRERPHGILLEIEAKMVYFSWFFTL
jgi:hypothetical protein